MNDDMLDFMIYLSEGDLNALSILMDIVSKGRNGIIDLVILDSLNIRGNLICDIYVLKCNKDFNKFEEYLDQISKSKNIIELTNTNEKQYKICL